MSLALEFLSDYLKRGRITQSDFAQAAGMTPPNVSDLLKGDVAISDRNLGKLLRGLGSHSDRVEFLSKHLEDQIPADLSKSITIRANKTEGEGMVMENGDDEPLAVQMVDAFNALPSDMYRKRVIRFLTHLRKDASLRDMFTRTVAYLEEDDSK